MEKMENWPKAPPEKMLRKPKSEFALALKIAQARVLMMEESTPPLLLIDDIFGELDPERRNLLLRHLPGDAQKLVTATTMQWRENGMEGPVFELKDGQLHRSA
jgi:DNA replication and repair protein RecF